MAHFLHVTKHSQGSVVNSILRDLQIRQHDLSFGTVISIALTSSVLVPGRTSDEEESLIALVFEEKWNERDYNKFLSLSIAN